MEEDKALSSGSEKARAEDEVEQACEKAAKEVQKGEIPVSDRNPCKSLLGICPTPTNKNASDSMQNRYFIIIYANVPINSYKRVLYGEN